MGGDWYMRFAAASSWSLLLPCHTGVTKTMRSVTGGPNGLQPKLPNTSPTCVDAVGLKGPPSEGTALSPNQSP